MSLLTDLVDAGSTDIVRLVPVPSDPLGYGTDLSCATDLTPDLAEVDPDSVQGMGESIIRFLTAERDSIPDAPGRGFNVFRMILTGMTPEKMSEDETAISAEVQQDDRFASATATVTLVAQRKISIRISVVPVDPALAPFDLVVAVSDGELLYQLLTAP